MDTDTETRRGEGTTNFGNNVTDTFLDHLYTYVELYLLSLFINYRFPFVSNFAPFPSWIQSFTPVSDTRFDCERNTEK